MRRLFRSVLLLVSLWGGVLLGGALTRAGVSQVVFVAMIVVPLATYSVIYRQDEGRWPSFAFFNEDAAETTKRHPPGSPPRRSR